MLAKQGRKKCASTTVNVYDCLVGDLLPWIISKDIRSRSCGTTAKGTVKLWYLALRLEVGEYVVVSVLVDVGTPALSVCFEGSGHSTRNIVKLIAMLFYPVVLLGPIDGA